MYRYAIQFSITASIELQDVLQVLEAYGERKEIVAEVV